MSKDDDDLIDIAPSDDAVPDTGLADRIYWALLIVFQAAMSVQAVLLLIEQQ